ncbi:hypothetical protein ACH5A2_03410 [Streptomyces collinus]
MRTAPAPAGRAGRKPARPAGVAAVGERKLIGGPAVPAGRRVTNLPGQHI